MSIDSLAIAGGAAIVAAPALIALFGRDPHANEHDLSDYHEPTPTNDAPRTLAHYEQLDRQDDVIWAELDDILPPAPELPELDPDNVPWTPPYADLAVDLVARRYGDNPADTADRWLRELGEHARLELTR